MTLTEAEARFGEYLEKENLCPCFANGVLVGFSGGPDSVLLLTLLSAYCKERGIPVLAFHVDHGIRGEESAADARFCEAFCKEREIPFGTEKISVPEIAAREKTGWEETARKERYRIFFDVCRERNLGAVVTGHNATDNAETVLLHMMRGGGTRALCGILPVRRVEEKESTSAADPSGLLLVRPLLCFGKTEIAEILNDAGIRYCTDSTNADVAYHRNYLRAEVLPRLRKLTPVPEKSILRLTENVREDEDFLARSADALYRKAFEPASGKLLRAMLTDAHPAMLSRLWMRYLMQCDPSAPRPEKVHLDAFAASLASGKTTFCISLPSGAALCADRKYIYYRKSGARGLDFGHAVLTAGDNLLADGSHIFLARAEEDDHSGNVYKTAIQADLSSAKINGELFVRSRRAGDAYRYGGMTRKVKKLIADAKIPYSERERLPVLCDEDGIVWIPGFGVRNDGIAHDGEKKHNLTVYYQPIGGKDERREK